MEEIYRRKFIDSSYGIFKAWIKDNGEIFNFPCYKNHQDVVDDKFDNLIKKNWIRIYVNEDKVINITCYNYDNCKFKYILKLIKQEKILQDCIISICDVKTNKVIQYKPMFREQIDENLVI